MFYDSKTLLKARKVPWTIYRVDKKTQKSIEEPEMNFPKATILKPSNINLALVSLHVRKKLPNLLTQLIQFTDQEI